MIYTTWKEWADDNGYARFEKPPIVTLCGSTRFVEEFNSFRQYFTLKGQIVLSIEIVTTQAREEDPQHVNRPNKEMLDLLHLEKIKMSDYIFVINKGGYIGESTQREIVFARSIDVVVEYMEHDEAPGEEGTTAVHRWVERHEAERFTERLRGDHALLVDPQTGRIIDPLMTRSGEQ